MVASASGNIVCVYSTETGQLIRDFHYDSNVISVSISSVHHHLCVQTENSTELREIKTGTPIEIFHNNNGKNHGENASGRYALLHHFVTGTLSLWDLWTGRRLRQFKHPMPYPWNFSSSPMGNGFGTACEDGNVRVYGVNCSQGTEMVYKHPEPVTCVALTDNAKWIFSGGDMVRMWDGETGEQIKEIKGYASPVITACLTRDEQRLLVGGYHGVLKMYDLTTGRQIRRFEKHNSWISSISVDEEQKVVATASHDGTAKIFSLSGQLIHTLSGHEDCLHAVAICSIKGIIATGGRDEKIMLWDIKSGKCVRAWNAHKGWVRSLAFDSTGTRLLSSGKDGLAKLWDLDGNRCVTEYGFHSGGAYSAVFSSDWGFVLTAGSDSTFKLFDVQGSLKMVFEGHVSGIREVFSHTDGTLISASLDGTAKRWDVVTGKCLQTYGGTHSQWIRCVWVRSDGILILGSKDGTLSFTDLETGNHFATLHNLDHGFLWTTPPDDNAKSGWFWTDREDLIQIMERDLYEKPILLETDSFRYKGYISTYNSRTQVMSRIRKNGFDARSFEYLVRIHTENQKGETHYRLLKCPESEAKCEEDRRPFCTGFI